MRLALVLLLINGLTPALGEIAEAVVHYAVAGHLAHSADDEGDLGEQGHEHGCGTTQHHCDCCASQAFASAPKVEVVASWLRAAGHASSSATLASLSEPTPPFRPPIAS